MPESGSTIPLVNVTTSGGMGAASTLSTAGITQVYNVSTAGAVGPVSSSYGILVTQTTGSVPTIAVTSSGGAFGAPLVLSTGGITQAYVVSTAGAVGLVTSSGGQLVAFSSGMVGGGIPVVQVTSSGGTFASAISLSTAGITQVYNVSTAGAVGPVSSSAGLLVVLSSGGALAGVPVINVTTSGGAFAGTVTAALSSGTGGGVSTFYAALTTVAAIKTAAGRLFSLMAFSTVAARVGFVQVFNLTTGSVTLGTSTPALVIPITPMSTSATATDNPESLFQWQAPSQGVTFGTAISIAPTTLTSNGTVASGNTYVDAVFA